MVVRQIYKSGNNCNKGARPRFQLNLSFAQARFCSCWKIYIFALPHTFSEIRIYKGGIYMKKNEKKALFTLLNGLGTVVILLGIFTSLYPLMYGVIGAVALSIASKVLHDLYPTNEIEHTDYVDIRDQEEDRRN